MLAWALGLSVVLALLDSGAGFVRDHPPRAWRTAGALVGPLTAAAALWILIWRRRWDLLALTGPFAILAGAYSLAWTRSWPARDRRRVGVRTAVVGTVTLLFLMLIGGPRQWACSVVMGAYAGSAALLGGFTLLFLGSAEGRGDEVAVSFSPYGLLARVVAVGLAMMAMAAGDLFRLRDTIQGTTSALGLWLVFSLAAPLLLVAAGHRLFPRAQRWIWAAACGCALVGQAAIHTVMMGYPGLVPG